MRQLGAAADQYFLENGVSTVSLTALVGSSFYVKALSTVANERPTRSRSPRAIRSS
jgi:type IV pilus assembly protein PilA